jgi:hypothetical protein
MSLDFSKTSGDGNKRMHFPMLAHAKHLKVLPFIDWKDYFMKRST